MSEKKKKQSRSLNISMFVLGWSLSYGMMWSGTKIIGNFMEYLKPDLFTVTLGTLFFFYILTSALLGLISGSIQQILLRLKFGISIPNWWIWTAITSAIAGSALFCIYEYGFQTLNYVRFFGNNYLLMYSITTGFIFTTPVVIQALLLHKRIRHLWIWQLVGLATGIAFMLFFTHYMGLSKRTLFLSFAGLAHGIILALTLVWLFNMMPRTELLKRGMESTQLEAAASNLTDNDSEQSHADYPDDAQMRQQS